MFTVLWRSILCASDDALNFSIMSSMVLMLSSEALPVAMDLSAFNTCILVFWLYVLNSLPHTLAWLSAPLKTYIFVLAMLGGTSDSSAYDIVICKPVDLFVSTVAWQ